MTAKTKKDKEESLTIVNNKEKNNKSIQAFDTNSLEDFKSGVDALLSKRDYFISQVLPKLKEGQDYFIIKGKKSLAKGGSEKLASIYQLVATFKQDAEVMSMLPDIKGMVCFVCNLKRGDILIGQGRGADMLVRNANDPNKTIKMAQKRAYIDAVIRATGLSDIFTQDLEDMNFNQPQPQRVQYVRQPQPAMTMQEITETFETEEMINDTQKGKILALKKLQKITDNKFAAGLMARFNKEKLEDLTSEEADNLINRLTK